MHCAFDISVIVFVIDSIPTETDKTAALFTYGKKAATKNEYYPLTNRARESYWGIEVVPVRTERRKRTDRSKVRTKIDRRPIFPVRLEVSKYFIMWYSPNRACFDFAGFRKQKVYSLWKTVCMAKCRP